MSENSKSSRYRRPADSSGPRNFDITLPKPKQQPPFPSVGMTLNAYQGNQSAAVDRRPRPSASRPGFFKRLRSKITWKRTILTVVALIVLCVGWVGWKFIYNAHRLFGGSVFSAFTESKLKGESTGRVNILLAGNSADDPGHQGANLTDSIIIMSIDTKEHTAFMLSVPRDLYVSIPGFGHQKINAAYPDGQSEHFSQSGYPSGGMGLLEKVIQQDLGITCDYYALVNYNALRDAVNDVGGVDITINSPDHRGLYDPSKDYATGGVLVKLSNGTHHLNGEQALDLARARGDAYGSYGFPNSDFDRTAHQRQLILALRSKATSAGVLANPIKLGKLFDAVGGNVKTDLSLGNVRRLYDVTKNIGGGGIQSIGLNNANGKDLLSNYRTASGESALVPAAGPDNYGEIQQFIQQITSNNPLVREAANVVVLNGTDTSGLAAKQAYILTNENINVAAVADADSDTYTTTEIINLSGNKMPATKAALQKAFSGSTVTTKNPFGSKYKADFIVVLGSDRLPKTSSNSSAN